MNGEQGHFTSLELLTFYRHLGSYRKLVFPFKKMLVWEMAWVLGEDQRNPLKVQDVQFWYIVACLSKYKLK